MEALISQLCLLDGDDYWAFYLDNSIDSSSISNVTYYMCNNILPIKCNIFSWRLANGRLPTRVNLDRRGIHLDSTRCPCCDQDLETETHIFLNCHVAADLWTFIFKWWALPRPTVTYVNEIFHISDLVHLRRS